MKPVLKIFPAICLLSLFITCKKDSKQSNTNTNSAIVGKWAFDSANQVAPGGTDAYNSQQYPCIKENIFTINSDGSATLAFTGKDTCYLVKPTASDPNVYSTAGTPGQSHSYTWTKAGTSFLLNPHDSNGAVVNLWATISTSNGQTQFVLKDTITDTEHNSQSIYSATYIKQ